MQPPVYARTQNKPAQKSAVFLTSFIKVDFPSTDQPCNLDSSERRVCERHEGPPSKPLQVIVLHAGIAAILFLAVLWRHQRAEAAASKTKMGKAPLWAYLGGIVGAATVMLTSTSVNTPLALAGTLALGLAGQVLLSLAADFWGLLDLPKRRLDLRDAGAVILIVAGSLLIILFGLNAA